MSQQAYYSSQQQQQRYAKGGGGGVPYADEVAADSPVAWWHVGDGAATAVDSIAALNGTYVNTPAGAGTLVLGGDGSHDFNGSNQYVTIPTSATLQPVTYTLEAWVNLDAWGAGRRVFSFPDNNVNLSIDATGHLNGVFYNGTVNRIVTSTAVLATGTTYHVAGTWSNVTKVLTVAINGVEAATATFAGESIAWSGTNAAIGSEVGGAAANCLNGRIDEVALYATALSAARLLAHFNAGT